MPASRAFTDSINRSIARLLLLPLLPGQVLRPLLHAWHTRHKRLTNLLDRWVILLPIMLYHQLQLFVCSLLANRYAARNAS